MAGFNPGNRRRLPHLDDHVQHAMNQCSGSPDETTGLMGTLVYAGCEDRERAAEIKRMVHRSAQHFKVSAHCDIAKQDDGTYSVTFSIFHKSYARRYMLEHYGSAENWPYRTGRKAAS